MVDRKRRLDCANGIRKADIVLKHGKVLNVFTEEILEADVAICGDTIVGVGSYEGEREIDCTGKYLVPGFLDAHMHIESSMVSPGELSKVLVQAGTTTIVADPHEIVNVCGVKGMDYFLKCAGKALVHIFFMIPSSVPATDVETNGCGEFLASDMWMMHECWDSGRPCVLWSVTRASAGCRISWNFLQRSTSTDMHRALQERRYRRTVWLAWRMIMSVRTPRKCSTSCAPVFTSISVREAVPRILKR